MIEKNLDTPEGRAFLVAEANPKKFDHAAWILSRSSISSRNKASWRDAFGDSQLSKRLRKAVEIIRNKQQERKINSGADASLRDLLQRDILDRLVKTFEYNFTFRRASSTWAGGKNGYDVDFCKHGVEHIGVMVSTDWSRNRKWSGKSCRFVLHLSTSDKIIPTPNGFYLLHVPTGTKITFKQSRGFEIRTTFHKEKHNGTNKE